jgi:hypothetical protein
MLPVSSPGDARHVVVAALSAGLHELVDGARGRIPQVDRVGEGDGQGVAGGPVQQVQVVVVDELGGVQDALGGLEKRGLCLRVCGGVLERRVVECLTFWLLIRSFEKRSDPRKEQTGGRKRK